MEILDLKVPVFMKEIQYVTEIKIIFSILTSYYVQNIIMQLWDTYNTYTV